MGLFDEEFVDNIKNSLINDAKSKQEQLRETEKAKNDEYIFLNTVYTRILSYASEFPSFALSLGVHPKKFKVKGLFKDNEFYKSSFGYISLSGHLYENLHDRSPFLKDAHQVYEFRLCKNILTEYEYLYGDRRYSQIESSNRHSLITEIKKLCYSYSNHGWGYSWGERLNEEQIEINIKNAFASVLKSMSQHK